MSWIQVPFISSTTHPNDPDNGTIALHEDESIEELIANEPMDPPTDGSDDDDDLNEFNQYVLHYRHPDFIPEP